MLEGLQIASTREAEPVKFAGDATAQVQLESTTDRTGNKFTGCVPACCLPLSFQLPSAPTALFHLCAR